MESISKRIGASLEDTGKAVKFTVFSNVIDNTRVKEGTARGNWQATEDAPASGTLDVKDPEGNITIINMSNKITGFGVTYLTNNLPYIRKLEELDGMVVKNVARVKGIIRRG